MSISFDSLIIIIVVVSSSIVIGVIAALCWMWRILRKDRRCARLQSPYGWTVVPQWPAETSRGAGGHVSPPAAETPDETALLANNSTPPPVVVPIRRESLYTASAPTWEVVTLRQTQRRPASHLQFATDDCEAPPPYAEK